MLQNHTEVYGSIYLYCGAYCTLILALLIRSIYLFRGLQHLFR